MPYSFQLDSHRTITLYGKEMRLPLDIIYREPLTEKSRADYANHVRCILEQAYDSEREKLHLAHE